MHNLKNIFVIAGGTAGHTLPAIELSNELMNRNYKIIFITDIRMFDFVNKNIKQNSKNIKVLCFKGRVLHKSNFIKNIQSIFLLIYSVMQSFINILSYQPKLAYGFGGGITVPPLMICRIFKIPIILHEGNKVLGRANKFLCRYSNILTTFFPHIEGKISKNTKNIRVGMPVRNNIEKLYTKTYKIKDEGLINILITGGSLGAEVMATEIAKALSSFPKDLIHKISIRQQVRAENHEHVKALYNKASIKYKIESYIENISDSLNWCHLIICRSGAGTIAENLISGCPSIMIPLPIASDNHQMKNALYVENIGAGWIIKENELYEQKILKTRLREIIFDKKILNKASKLAKKYAIRNANINLADIGHSIINGMKY